LKKAAQKLFLSWSRDFLMPVAQIKKTFFCPAQHFSSTVFAI
jgi:hypothetical protein